MIAAAVLAAPGLAAAQSARPDLVVRDATSSPALRHPGDALTVHYRVANTGSAKAGR